MYCGGAIRTAGAFRCAGPSDGLCRSRRNDAAEIDPAIYAYQYDHGFVGEDAMGILSCNWLNQKGH